MIGFLFILIAAFVLLCSITTVMSKNLMHSAIALFFSFIGFVTVYLLLALEMLAFVQLFIFVGAVSVLTMFSLMMLREYEMTESNPQGSYRFAGLVVACLVAGLLVGHLSFLAGTLFPHESMVMNDIPVTEIAKGLLTEYALAFELISLVLLSALIGTVALLMRKS